MAREYANFRTDIVGDDDFRELTPLGQHLYYSLTIDPTLSHCGVADWRPARIAGRAKGWTADAVRVAAVELIDGLFIVVDEATEEVLIRSHIKHDGLMKNPRMAVSMMTAYAAVASKTIRGVIVHEVVKLRKNQPDLASWESKYSGEKLRNLMRREAVDPTDLLPETPEIKGSVYPKIEAEIYPKISEVKGSTSPTPSPTPSPSTSYEVEGGDSRVGIGLDAPATSAPAADPEPPAQPPQNEPSDSGKQPRGTRLPESWEPRPSDQEKLTQQCPEVDLAIEVENFRDWARYVSGQRGVKSDWDAAWRSWVRREAKSIRERAQRFAGRAAPAPRQTRQEQNRDFLAQQLAALDTQDNQFQIRAAS